MKKNFGLIFLLALVIFGSCRKDDIIKQQGVNLRFSADTVFLDTVLTGALSGTGVGSSTYILKVYNDENAKVIIDHITLGKPNGCYRLNINGTSANSLANVEILPKDSIYIFIEITDKSSCPKSGGMVYEDEIIFTNKGTVQSVQLNTLIQPAYFHYPTNFLVIGESPNAIVIPYSVIARNDTTWPNDFPHVIYGYGIIDEGATLRISGGTEVYFHQNSGMWVYNGGSLKIAEGSTPGLGDSVTFAGDRLEPAYENYPGQWGGVLGGIFVDDSARVVINNTVIKNAVNAIRLDSAQFTDQLKLTNSYILNTSRTALRGGFGSVEAENVVIANSGYYGLYCFGGNYSFKHCTFANYWNQSTRTVPAVLLTNYFDYLDDAGRTQRIVRPLQSAYFGNCIIYGNNAQELRIEKDDANTLQYQFNHVLLKLDNDPEDRGFNINDPGFIQPRVNFDPLFVDVEKNNYDIKETSAAINQGNTSDIVPLDIKGRLRSSGNPDLGAFEFQQ